MFFKRLLLAGAVASVMLAVCIQPVMAQQVTSSIVGVVVDPDGNPVEGAEVTVTDTRTNRRVEVTTGASGQFNVRGLEVGGPYSVQVESADLVDERVDDVFVTLSDAASLRFALEAASAELGELQVIGLADVTSFQRAIGPGSSFDLEDINNLPSISRDVRDIVRVDPRVSIDGSFGDAVSCGGANARFNSITVDGVRQDDNFGLNTFFPGEGQQFPLDAIGQASVEFAPFSVEYGQFTGCNINVVTKSGTNEFTGGIFEYYTSDGISDSDIGDFDSHNFGAFVGGPIIKDRVFLFVSYEETIGSVAIDDGPAGSGFPNQADGITQADIDSIRNILLNTYNFDPGALPLNSANADNRRILVRLDANITDDHRLAFNYQRTREDFTTLQNTNATFDELAFSSNFYNSGNEIDSYSLRLFSNWTSNFSTEIRASRFDNQDLQNSLNGTDFAEFNIILPSGGEVVLGPDFFRQANDLRTQTDQIKIKGDFTADQHTFTIGYELDSFDVFNLFVPASRGEVIFDGIDALAAQDPSQFQFNGAISGDLNDAAAIFERSIHTFYAQDTWRPTGALTLVGGLRYDLYKSDDDPISNPIFQQRYGFDNAAQVYDGLEALQPRFGFSYELPAHSWGFTSLHGGAGIFSGGDPGVIFSGSFTNTGITTDNVFITDDSGLLGPGSVNGFDIPQFAIDQLIAGDGQVAAVDPDFDLPTVFRANIGFSHEFYNDLRVSVDYIYSDAINPLAFQALNIAQVGTAPDGRPIYREVDFLDPDCAGDPGNAATCDSRFTDDILLTNGNGGRIHNVSFTLEKGWYDIANSGVDFETTIGYSFVDATEVHPVTSSVPTSNFGNFSADDFNNPSIANANDGINHNAIFRGTLRKAFFGDYYTTLNLFASIRSGRPFSYTFDTGSSSNNLFGDSLSFEDRSLLYVPLENDPSVVFGPNFDLAAFNAFLAESGLDQFRGQIAPRNAFNSSTFTDLDIRISQELPGFFSGDKITLFFDIENFLNLIDSDANELRQIGFEFNNPVVDASINENGQFSFDNFDGPNSEGLISAASLWQIQLGIRYDF